MTQFSDINPINPVAPPRKPDEQGTKKRRQKSPSPPVRKSPDREPHRKPPEGDSGHHIDEYV